MVIVRNIRWFYFLLFVILFSQLSKISESCFLFQKINKWYLKEKKAEKFPNLELPRRKQTFRSRKPGEFQINQERPTLKHIVINMSRVKDK